MDTIRMTQLDTSDARCTGLYISYKDEIGLLPPSRQELLRMIQEQLNLPLTIEMPCSEVATYESLEDIPLVDTPCPCGDPDHWSVRWEAQ